MNVSWIEVSGKKRNRNSFEMSTLRKQAKMNRYQLSKPVLTNFFEGLEEVLNDENNNIRMEKTAKPPEIFVARINNFSLLSQKLKEIASDKYEIKIMNEQIKIQPKSSITNVNIMKELKSRNTEFHTYKPKQERSFKSPQTHPCHIESG